MPQQIDPTSDATPPVLVNDGPLTVSTDTIFITPGYLKASDPDNSDSQLTYTVLSQPSFGALLKNSNPVSSFTQADIDSRLISYTWNGSIAGADSFRFNVSDPQGNSTGIAGFPVFIVQNPAPTSFGANWNIAGSGDFNSDQLSDLAYQRTSDGLVEVQFLSGRVPIGGGAITNSPFDASWQVAAAGDFNGDGLSDLVYRRSSDGLSEIQFLNGNSAIGGGAIANSPFDSAWAIAATGDFNHDGKADLVWQRTLDGLVEVQLLNGDQSIGGGLILNSPFDNSWKVAGTGEFNGDGSSDLVYRRPSDGLTEIQFLNGNTAVGGGAIANNAFDASWQVVGVGDFNGDGFADLVYRRPSDGLTEIQFLHGTTAIGGGVIANNPFDASWQVAGVGDFNGDGVSDLVYHQASSGLTGIEFLKGTSVLSGGAI